MKRFKVLHFSAAALVVAAAMPVAAAPAQGGKLKPARPAPVRTAPPKSMPVLPLGGGVATIFFTTVSLDWGGPDQWHAFDAADLTGQRP